MAWTSWRSYFSCSGYSASILTWKYCVGCLLVYFGDFVLVLLAGGISGEGDGVTGFLMLGDGVSCAVCGGLETVMVSGVVSIICSAGGEVSFSAYCRLYCRRRSGRRWSSSSCGLAWTLASRGCRLPPAFGPLLEDRLRR